jgi:malonyl CoA-acyl carrier protein transacylase
MNKNQIAFVFPGQGSQNLKMGKDIYDAFLPAKHVFEEVDEALKFKLSNIIFGEDEEALKKTENTQAALMAVSIATLRVIEAETGKKAKDLCGVMAGHSLGEYSALCAAGAISLKETAIILKKRGELMASSFREGGAMLALIGVEASVVESIILKVLEGNEVLVIANDNSPGQIVISGNETAIEKARIEALACGAKIAVKLPVSGPFHSPLLKEAAEKMEEEIKKISIKQPEINIINNVDLEVYSSASQIASILPKQITSKVRWRETMLKMEKELQIKKVFEIGAGKVLGGLFKRTSKEISVVQTFDLPSVIKAIEELSLIK